MTEKFGTMTLIQSLKSKVSKVSNEVTWWLLTWWLSTIKYELTPLRTESDYSDFRHPDEITRSNDILLDSQRRDFTINAIYYTTASYSTEYTKCLSSKTIYPYTEDSFFLKKLETHGYVFIKEEQLLILQSSAHIAQLFPEGTLDKKQILPLLNSAIIFSIGKKKVKGKRNLKPAPLRIIIDPQKGLQDSIHRKLQAVGEADKRFNEDALRIIRAIRFVNVLNEKLKDGKIEKLKNNSKISLFDFEKSTWNSIKKNHALVQQVAKERIKEEIMKAFTVWNPFGFVALLDEAKLLEHLFPALYETKNVDQPIRYHPFDIYTHTMLCLFELQKINKHPLVRLAMLYHDVGKVDQFGAYAENLSKEEIRAIIAGPLNHRRSSPEYAKRDFKALGFSSKEIETIARYIAHHHTPEEMIFAKEDNTEKKVRTFLSEAGYEKAMDIFDITMADRLGQYNPLQNSSDLSDVDKLKHILTKLHKEEGQFTMKDLAIDGLDIIQELKLPAWPAIGKLLKKSLDWVMTDIKTRNTKKEIFGFLKIQLKHINSTNNE